MTANSTSTATSEPVPHRSSLARSTQWATGSQPLYAIAGAQAVWLTWAYGRGWYLQADLSNLAEGVGRRLDWSYLSAPLGGHFGPVGRLLYWLFDRLGPLNYSVTVGFRVIAMVAATALLYRLLILLVGRRPLVPVVVAACAFNPMVLAGTAWFTAGAGLALAGVLVLLFITEYVRYEHGRDIRHAAAAGALLGGAVLTSDQWVVAALIPPVLFLGYFSAGPTRQRLRALSGRWPAWLCLYAPLAAVVAAQFGFSNRVGAAPLSFGDGVRLLRDAWSKSLAPAGVGGPWHWFAGRDDFVSFAAPPGWMILLGQLGVAAVVVLGVRRLGPRSLVAWVMPISCSVAGILLVGYGRFATYGDLLAITPRYVSAFVPLFAVGAALALAPLADPDGTPPAVPRHAVGGSYYAIGGVALTAVLVSSVVSGARFADRLGKSPVENYVKNLEVSARTRGPGVNIYDTAVAFKVIASYEPRHRVSDILRLAGVPARFDEPTSDPLVVTPDGHLAKAVFVAGPTVLPTTGDSCGTFVHGAGTWTYPLDHVPARAEWFLRLELYQATPSNISIELVDERGATVQPIRGATVQLGTLEARNLAMPLFAPSAVRIHSAQPGTNLCLTRIAIGGPFPVGGDS